MSSVESQDLVLHDILPNLGYSKFTKSLHESASHTLRNMKFLFEFLRDAPACMEWIYFELKLRSEREFSTRVLLVWFVLYSYLSYDVSVGWLSIFDCDQ